VPRAKPAARAGKPSAKNFAVTWAVRPVTVEIAELAGRIDGAQAARGIRMAFEDLLPGGTALCLDFAVATMNIRHFEQIRGLKAVPF